MKKLLTIMSSLIVMTQLCPLGLKAHDFTYTYEGQTLNYTVIDENAKTCKTKDGNNGSSRNNQSGNDVSGVLIIPEIAKDGDAEYTVTEIGTNSFKWAVDLTSVTISNSVTTIKGGAFDGCEQLKSVTIPASVKSIENRAFSSCYGLTEVHINDLEAWCRIDFEKINSDFSSNPLSISGHLFLNGIEITNLAIPSSITILKPYAFQGCQGLTSVTIPASVTEIGQAAFEGCKNLTSLTIGNSVTTISDNAFYLCGSLKSVTIPDSVKSIGQAAFAYCKNLTSLTIGNSVTTISDYAFSSCGSLKSVTIPNSVIYLGNSIFDRCNIENLTMLAKCTFDISEIDKLKSLTAVKDASIINGMESIFNVTSQATHSTATFNITRKLTPEISLKIIDNTGHEISIKDAVSLNSGKSCRWEGENLIIKSTFPGEYCEFHLLQNYGCYTKDISVNVIQTAGFADLAKVSASFDAGDFIPQDYSWEYYWDYNNIHALNADIMWPTEQVTFFIEGKNYKRQSPNLRLAYPEPQFTDVNATATSLNKCRLTAKCNLSNGTEAHIEWRRSDAPDNVKSNEAVCPVVAGHLMGELKGLREDIYYKYRPYYKRGGIKYFGEWVGFYTGDACVYFEPEVGTLPAIPTNTGISLEGYAYGGTDDITDAGFEYRSIGINTRSNDGWAIMNVDHNIYMSVSLDNLAANTRYEYRAFARAGGNTYYGETEEFTTTENVAGIMELENIHQSTLTDAILIENPVVGFPKVRITTTDGLAHVMIFTLDGRLIHSGKIIADGSAQEIEIRLNSGIYILNILTNDGPFTFRLIAK